MTQYVYVLAGALIGFGFGTLYGIRLAYARNRQRKLIRREQDARFRPVPNPHPLHHPVSRATLREIMKP